MHKNKKNKFTFGDGSPHSYGHGDKHVPDSIPATRYNKFMFKNVIPKIEKVIKASTKGISKTSKKVKARRKK